jgi:hypothetical protein
MMRAGKSVVDQVFIVKVVETINWSEHRIEAGQIVHIYTAQYVHNIVGSIVAAAEGSNTIGICNTVMLFMRNDGVVSADASSSFEGFSQYMFSMNCCQSVDNFSQFGGRFVVAVDQYYSAQNVLIKVTCIGTMKIDMQNQTKQPQLIYFAQDNQKFHKLSSDI